MNRPAASSYSHTPTRVALVGCGAVSELYYAPALSALEREGKANVVALLDPDPTRVDLLRTSFPKARPVSELSTLTSDRIDLAIVASPPRFHAGQTIRLLQSGVHVLCEKPLASTPVEAEAMVETAERYNRLLAVGLMRRFFPATRTIRRMLAERTFGEVRTFSCFEGGTFRWPTQSAGFFQRTLAGGGVLLDLGVHALDLLVWWMGYPVDVLYEDDAMGGLEANARIRLTFENGCSGEVRLSRDWSRPNRYTFECDGGRIFWNVHEPARLETVLGREVPMDVRLTSDDGTNVSFPVCFSAQLRNVLQAVAGTTPLEIPAVEALPSLRLVESCYHIRQPMPMEWMSASEQRKAVGLHAEAAP